VIAMKYIGHNYNRSSISPAFTDKGHYYTINEGGLKGKKVPSVTTVLKAFPNPGLDAWKNRTPDWKQYSKESLDVGNKIHEIMEWFANSFGEGPLYHEQENTKGFPCDVGKMSSLAIKWFYDHVDNIRGAEIPVFSERLRLAGTIDLVAEVDGKLSIIDYKNSRKPKTPSLIKRAKYFVQGAAYAQMWKECTGETIDQICIVVISWDNKIKIFKSTPEKHMSELWDTLIAYEALTP